MLPPPGKARKIAKKVMKGTGIDMPKAKKIQKTKDLTGPYLIH